jgi:sugar phosphate isomerase/epimerase
MPDYPQPLYGVSEWSTPKNGVFEDIEQIARTGGTGIGLWEAKWQPQEDAAVQEALQRHGLTATMCIPKDWTILPTPLDPKGPQDWRARVDIICAGIHRLARFSPVAILVGPGVSGDPARRAGPVEAVIEGLRVIADAAAEYGLRVGFEPLSLRRGAAVATLPETVSVLDAVDRPNVEILFDVWHSWDEPDVHEHIRAHAHRFIGVQVNDYRQPTRSWCDRVLPGEGQGAAPEIMATLLEAGFEGWYDFEIMSDDGRWGNAFPDSLWALPHEQMLGRAFEAFQRSFERAKEIVVERRARQA